MIATVSPSNLAYEETMNTLKYASRAMNIKTHSTQNVVQKSNNISDYSEILSR